jgi:RNA polymerase primary sigma factor
MKKYNITNYVKYKKDVEFFLSRVDRDSRHRDDIIIMFLPLVEGIARKFTTTQQAIGVLNIEDLIQEGNIGLVTAVDKIDWEKVEKSDDKEKTIISFLSKRIKGAIRRAIDKNRGDIRIPEHKINQIRKDSGKDKEMVAMFFNSIFLSVDEQPNVDDNYIYDIPDSSEPYNIDILNTYLMGLLKKNLNDREYEVLRLSYGLDCEKHNAKQIAEKIGIFVETAHVRVSQIKKDAIDKLIANTDHSQILDHL